MKGKNEKEGGKASVIPLSSSLHFILRHLGTPDKQSHTHARAHTNARSAASVITNAFNLTSQAKQIRSTDTKTLTHTHTHTSC